MALGFASDRPSSPWLAMSGDVSSISLVGMEDAVLGGDGTSLSITAQSARLDVNTLIGGSSGDAVVDWASTYDDVSFVVGGETIAYEAEVFEVSGTFDITIGSDVSLSGSVVISLYEGDVSLSSGDVVGVRGLTLGASALDGQLFGVTARDVDLGVMLATSAAQDGDNRTWLAFKGTSADLRLQSDLFGDNRDDIDFDVTKASFDVNAGFGTLQDVANNSVINFSGNDAEGSPRSERISTGSDDAAIVLDFDGDDGVQYALNMTATLQLAASLHASGQFGLRRTQNFELTLADGSRQTVDAYLIGVSDGTAQFGRKDGDDAVGLELPRIDMGLGLFKGQSGTDYEDVSWVALHGNSEELKASGSWATFTSTQGRLSFNDVFGTTKNNASLGVADFSGSNALSIPVASNDDVVLDVDGSLGRSLSFDGTTTLILGDDLSLSGSMSFGLETRDLVLSDDQWFQMAWC